MIKIGVVIASYQRLQLLQQTIESLRKNTDSVLQIVVVDDFSQNPEIDTYLKGLHAEGLISYYRYNFRVPIHAVKNKGYLMLDSNVDYIHFSDNDIYYEPHWDSTLIRVLAENPEIGIVGGLHHPHHQIDEVRGDLIFSNEQPGYSIFMRADDFKLIGPWFSELLAGGEDSNLCIMAREYGFKIAAVNPPVILHCGASGSHGNKAADYPQIMKLKEERPELYVE